MQSFKDDEKLQQLKAKYLKLCELLTFEEVFLDKKLFLNLDKQKRLIEPIIVKLNEYEKEIELLDDFKHEIEKVKTDEKNIYELEIIKLEEKIKNIESELINKLNSYNAQIKHITIEIVTIKNGNGKLFKTIIKGYENFCKQNNLTFNIEEKENKSLIAISGYNAKEFFNEDIGIHKSLKDEYCQVFVYESTSYGNIEINEKDITISTCRSSGAGGQHINTTDSAIRVVHNKTGISAICQDERSQFQNKQKAIERLKEKVLNFYASKKQEEIDKQKKEQIKLIKNNFIAKSYDFENNIILKADKQVISINDFLQGKYL